MVISAGSGRQVKGEAPLDFRETCNE